MNVLTGTAAKLGILIVLALIFGATFVALSVRTQTSPSDSGMFWDDGYGKDTKRFEKTFSVEPGGDLVVAADIGDITVSGTDSQEAVVVVTVRGSGRKLDEYLVDFSQNGNVVRVEAKNDRRFFRFFNNGGLDVRYDIRLPRNFNLDLNTSGGNLRVENVKGRIEGETSGGDIDLSNLDGLVRLSTSGGNVMVTECEGDYVLRTSGGNIEGDHVHGPFDIETSGGNISVTDADGKLRAYTSGGDIRVALNDNKGIDLSTSGGNVTVHIPRNASATVDAETSGGDVDTDLEFSGKIKEGEMHGTINGGGNAIRIQTSGGDIAINSRK